MTIQRINPDELFKLDSFSQVVKTSEVRSFAFIAGQGSFDRDFQLIGPGDVFAQTLAALRNLRTAVEAAGTTVDNIVTSTVYIVGLNDETAAAASRAIAEALDGKPFPPHAMSMIGVAALAVEGMLVEISAVAAVP